MLRITFGLMVWTCSVFPIFAATWQYQVPFEPAKPGKDGKPGQAYLWLPPESKSLRGLLIGGQLKIELELALDPEVRRACGENDIGIVYFVPHVSSLFHYWQEGSTDARRFLQALESLAEWSGHPELRRVPWITMGHSTAGIFCRNVAYWQPRRVAGVIHIKSGNFFQKEHSPPGGNLAGVPLIAINGQFETFGPEGGIRPELGRETQWMFVRQDLQRFRQKDVNHLMSLWLDLGGDHFHGSRETADLAALFLRKTAKFRLPLPLSKGDDPVHCLPVKAEDGWLSDANLYDPQHGPAPYKDYLGDKKTAFWHYDGEMARAIVAHHRKLRNHQCLANPTFTWFDEGDGWTFQARAAFLDEMPRAFGGKVSGLRIGHAETPIVFRAKIDEPVQQMGPDTFRILRPVKSVNIAAVHPGNEQYRPTNRWAGLPIPNAKGKAQKIVFPSLADVSTKEAGIELKARSDAGLPIHYEVDFGPVLVKEGRAVLSELPRNPRLPIACRITAYQIGRRVEPLVAPALPVSQEFKVVTP